ncbi:Transcriptional regulator GlxA family, contains an amidase domain and an AraC-type DNA-binding HTH domain [Amycolatopsis pretoriensis]|uniref:Transcriptional regulator GlxA family, contains an amidase domain and an AraC-type DNA-binding HTH domain n=1 Tax=Amycolatopsis pretoriensis TaxID=218821 RepID=A0A1H5Q1L8_9PSEU|nr:helix-turn-helix domain-containing protein [Amycolatopsis pretoriensis]SEF19915.1 Transcriptional regulator GlxA family, contains an amidase domain and an AraC-type DNA-binding HTH domain [Amycolatopsis pretoriensis]
MNHRVTVLALPGVLALDVGIPVQVFGSDPNYELTVCADRRPVPVGGGGLTIAAGAGLEALPGAKTVIVPGYDDVGTPPAAEVLDALRAAHARGARIVSICTGAFALAEAGLLDGRPATTHWRFTAEFRSRFPRVRVLPNQLYVDDGDILTSAGVTAGIDLCLHLIRTDRGAAAANAKARLLVAPPHRTGGQAQYIERLRPEATGDRLGPLREWLLADLAREVDVDTLAARVHLSRRTFLRRFREETGTSPMAWLTAARLDRARELLETTDLPVEHLGRHTGLGSTATVRAAFHRHLGTSPRDYRALFRASQTETAAAF